MSLNLSRRIIVVILEIVLAVSTVIFLFSAMMTFTAADKNYFINSFANESLVNECENQLNAKYEALSSETNIPARVFERVKDDYPTNEALRQAALSIFSEENETLYSESKISYFYELSIEYLEGNGVQYNKEDVKRAAKQAARIYSDTVGLHNTGGIEARINSFSKKYPKITLISLVISCACFPSIMIMYKRKKGGYYAAIGGVLIGSAATAMGTVLAVLLNLGGGIDILPEIHKQSIMSTTIKDFLILSFISILISASAISIMKIVDNKIKEED